MTLTKESQEAVFVLRRFAMQIESCQINAEVRSYRHPASESECEVGMSFVIHLGEADDAKLVKQIVDEHMASMETRIRWPIQFMRVQKAEQSDMIPRVGQPDGYPRLGCGTLAVPGMKIYDKDGGEQTLLYCDRLGGDDNFRCRYAWDSEYSPLIDFTAAPPIQAPTANSLLAECLHVLTKGVQPRMTERWPALKHPVDNLVAKLSLFIDAKEHP